MHSSLKPGNALSYAYFIILSLITNYNKLKNYHYYFRLNKYLTETQNNYFNIYEIKTVMSNTH